jgi:tyrosinase
MVETLVKPHTLNEVKIPIKLHSQTKTIRRNILDIQKDYEKGDKKPLSDLMRAWKGIKEKSPEELKSFFVLGGLHGEPFRGKGLEDPKWWGGFCTHGSVLFPSWHRA